MSSAGDYFLNGINSAMNQLANWLYHALGGMAHQQSSTNGRASPPVVAYSSSASAANSSTFVLLFSILVSLFVFLCIVCAFICWRVRCCCCCRRGSRGSKHRRLSKSDKLMSVDDLMRREQDKLLISGPTMTIGRDHTDHHNGGQNYANLVNDSSATLVSNTKASNSIRMAYPNYSNQLHHNNHHQHHANGHLPPSHHLNDIYANHSLLTTTSSATGSSSYPPPPPPPPPPHHQAIAIDTSNHTPRYHLLHHQQQQDCYYDDLRYNGDEPNRTSPSISKQAIFILIT